jgi:hypothetical protein
MLDRFDWLRRSRTGAELLATLRYLQNHPKLSTDNGELGPPFSALNGPCLRCWVYPRTSRSNARHCSTCQAILSEAWRLGTLSRDAVVIWGFVNQLPRQLHSDAADAHSLGAYVHDERHFLMMLYYRDLQSWFQELIIYHGTELKGLIQIFPTTGGRDVGMGDLLCRVVHNEARFPQDKLRVRFYAATYQVLDPRTYDREGVLTFEVSEFLRMLDLAVVFRSVLLPDEQKILRKLLSAGDTRETQFYWGRFVGTLSQEAKDMLNAWKIRQWSGPQVDLLYELVEYVGFSQFR